MPPKLKTRVVLDKKAIALIEKTGLAGLQILGQAGARRAQQPWPIGSPRLTGTNARSIDWILLQSGKPIPPSGQNGTAVPKEILGKLQRLLSVPRGPTVAWFTSSGYGGYIELGTRAHDNFPAMPARPYLAPMVRWIASHAAEILKKEYARLA